MVAQIGCSSLCSPSQRPPTLLEVCAQGANVAVQSPIPFGLCSAPWMFTKLLKLLTSCLRKLGMRILLHLDDMLLMARGKTEAKQYLATALTILTALGFGFRIDSYKMRIEFPSEI